MTPQDALPQWLSEFPLDRCVSVDGDLLQPLGEGLWASLRLIRVGDALVRDAWWMPDLQFDAAYEHAQLALYRRAKLLVEATVELLSAGYAEQALAQLRVLFETMLDAFRVLQNHDKVESHLQRHADLHRHDYHQWLSSVGSDQRDQFGPARTDGEMRALRREFGKSWTGQSLWDRIKDWETLGHEDLARPGDSGRLREAYNIMIRTVNLHVHGSQSGIFVPDGTDLVVGEGPTSASHRANTFPTRSRITRTGHSTEPSG